VLRQVYMRENVFKQIFNINHAESEEKVHLLYPGTVQYIFCNCLPCNKDKSIHSLSYTFPIIVIKFTLQSAKWT
jgi:hypothetical protein